MSSSATCSGGERLTVHQLLRALAPQYRERFGQSMPGRHREVLNRILSCRTAALGGQLFQCPSCHAAHYRYHSCNDRHCPQCGQPDAEQWLEQQRGRLLLPVPYFLVTFTVPEELRRFIRSHQQLALDLLFSASAGAMQDLASNLKRLGARLGMLGVLHTWSRTLIYHPHVHYLVPAGGLSLDDRRWISTRHRFLLPLRPLGARYRHRFREGLQAEHPELLGQIPAKVWKRGWNVDVRPAGSGENALRYLSRYVFKTATGNRHVEWLPDGKVRWPYRESQTGRQTSIDLAPLDWMSRFLQHILPAGFARVRTFGWLHPAAKVRCNRVRALLKEHPLLTQAELDTWKPPPSPEVPPAQSASDEVLPVDPPAIKCPRCGKPMSFVAEWFAGDRIPLPNRPP